MLYCMALLVSFVSELQVIGISDGLENNVTHRHSLFYAHLAIIRVCHIDLINRVYRTHSLRCPVGHDEE